MFEPINFSRDSIKNGSKSFSLSALLLAKNSRPGVYALYSWCRTCDDLVDLELGGAKKPGVSEIRDWTFQDPVIQSLTDEKYLERSDLEQMLMGMRMDQDHRGYQTLEELEYYCFSVAGVVGLMMCSLLGVLNHEADDHAIALGVAMQLTNICRDIQEDALRERVYVPLEYLSGLSAAGLINANEAATLLATHPERAHEAVKVLLARADSLYLHGRQGLRFLPFRAALAVGVAGRFYQLIGHRLLKLANHPDHPAFRRRTVVPMLSKLIAVIYVLVWTIFNRWSTSSKSLLIFPQWARQMTERADPSGL